MSAASAGSPADVRAGAVPARDFLVDSHAHLSMVADRLGESAIEALDEAWKRAAEAAPPAPPFLVDVGVDPEDFVARKRRFGGFPWVRLSAGAWPAAGPCRDRANALAAVRESAADPACAAVGECGLDYHHDEAPRQDQLELFLGQAEVARSVGKPLVVHTRDALEDTLGALREADLGTPVVIHCFGYDKQAARRFLDLGCMVSFAGNATYPKASALAEALAYVPDGRLLLETDAPWLAPEGLRGRPCSPLDICHLYWFTARLRGMEPGALEAVVGANARAVFG